VSVDEHSLFMVLRIGYFYVKCVERNASDQFFRLHEASEVLSFSPGFSLVPFNW